MTNRYIDSKADVQVPRIRKSAMAFILGLGILATIALSPGSSKLGPNALSSSSTSPAALVSVYLGFAYSINGYSDSPYPFPTTTATPVTFNGHSVSANSSDYLAGSNNKLDSGTVLINNTSGYSETITNLAVKVGSTTYPTSSSWAAQTISSSQGMIADQTVKNTNFNPASIDTSCTTPNTTIPTITFTVTIGSNSVNESFSDSGEVLTDGGYELYGASGCTNNSDGEAWTPLGQSAPLPPVGGAAPAMEDAGRLRRPCC